MRIDMNHDSKDVNDLNFHDAIIIDFVIGYDTKKIELKVNCYEDDNSSKRSLLKITFLNVDEITHNCNLLKLNEHLDAGNVNYWSPAEAGNGRTYFYLLDGYFSISHSGIFIEKC